MKIIVCVKIVLSKWVNNNINEKFIINPFDVPAIRSARKIVNECGGTVTCISMGSEASKEALRKCIALGADETILVEDRRFAGSDTLATSYILSKAVKEAGDYDLILCGGQSVDGDTGQVPVELATRLEIPWLVHVESVALGSQGKLECIQNGSSEIMKYNITLPALLSLKQFDTNPVSCSLMQMKRARNKKIQIMDSSVLHTDSEKCGSLGSQTQVIETRMIQKVKKKSCELQGEPEEKVKKILEIIGY